MEGKSVVYTSLVYIESKCAFLGERLWTRELRHTLASYTHTHPYGQLGPSIGKNLYAFVSSFFVDISIVQIGLICQHVGPLAPPTHPHPRTRHLFQEVLVNHE